MNEAPDPLETELSALRPRPVSPELRQRVAERLNTRHTGRQWVWGAALIGALTTVGVLLSLPGRKDPPPVPAISPTVAPAPPPAPAESESPAPSVLAYQRALARSHDELTALLDKHAATAPDRVLVVAFTRSNTTLDALIGDD
jgi:hypothetical protein